MTLTGKKTHLLHRFTQNNLFTKTGSGQTQGQLRQRCVFFGQVRLASVQYHQRGAGLNRCLRIRQRREALQPTQPESTAGANV